MKSIISKLTLFLFFCLFMASVFSAKANANSPAIKGAVLEYGTNKPIPGVWVKWTDKKNNIRYAQTDGNGVFQYPGWQNQTDRGMECSASIDTNLDGVFDATIAKSGNSEACTEIAKFGCKESPHSWSVVKPSSWNGEFSSTSGVDISNVYYGNEGSFKDIGVFYWKPSAPSVCDCKDLTATGDLKAGSKVTFTSVYKVTDPLNNLGEVTKITFTMNRNSTQAAKKEVVPVSSRVGNDILYTASFDYLIPQSGTGNETFYLSTGQTCGRRVAGNYLRNLAYGILSAGSGKAYALMPVSSLTETCSPDSKNSLQLCTFIPQIVEKTCNSVKFTISYPIR